MNTRPTPFLSAALLAATTLCGLAQTAFVHRIGGTLSASVDVDSDARRDLVLLDSATGILRLGTMDAAGAVSWTMKDTAVPGATGIAITPSININYPSLFLTSPAFNQVRIVHFDSTPDSIFAPPFAEPTLLAPYAAALSGSTNGVFTANATQSAAPSFSANPAWASVWSIGGFADIRQGNGFSFTPTAGIGAAFLKDVGGTASLHVQLGTTASSGTAVSLPGLHTSSRWTSRLYGSNATVFTWVPGTGAFVAIHPTSNPSAGVYQFGTSAFHTLPSPVDAIIPLETTDFHEFAVLHTNGTTGLYRFNPAAPALTPVLVQTLTATGGKPQALLPLGANAFALLRRELSGVESLQKFTWNGSSYIPSTLTIPPGLSSRPVYSNVLFFQREPFVDPDPAEVHRQRVGDWTVSVTTVGIAKQVATRTDQGPATGLSSGTTSSLVNNPAGAVFSLPSQIDANSSLHLFSGNTPGGVPSPQFSPAPGAQSEITPGGSLTVRIAVPAGATLYVQNGGGGFTVNATGSANLTIPGTVRAYARLGNAQSPISSATYTYLATGAPALPSVPDANNDNVSDAWASLTGATDPSADTDGDGILNYAEYLAGTDPASASSSPGSGPVPALTVGPGLGGTAVLTWNSTDPALLLERSANLGAWTVETKNIVRNGAVNQFVIPSATPATPRGYWRLRR